jgi:hypothetical protein
MPDPPERCAFCIARLDGERLERDGIFLHPNCETGWKKLFPPLNEWVDVAPWLRRRGHAQRKGKKCRSNNHYNQGKYAR